MDPNEYVPVMIPAGKHVNIGCVGIRLNADLHAMAHYGTLCLSESVWRHVVLAIGVENFHAGSVQRSRRRATDSLQGTRWYIRTRTHRINRWVL